MDNWRFAQVIMRPSYEEQLAFWECKNWPMAIIPRWRSYKETFYRESSRECLNWRSYEGGALIKVADSAISTVSVFENLPKTAKNTNKWQMSFK